MPDKILIRSAELKGAEISWFAPLCSDDYRYLGVPENQYKSSFEHTKEILLTADRLGFRNILCPSSYQVGPDTLAFAAAVAPMTKQINLLVAIRCGEIYPAMLARSLATLDHILQGRLTVNIISSDFPGQQESASVRYERSREVIQILKQAWTQEQIDFNGKYYQLKLNTDPVKPYQQNGGPLLYFGGYSPEALELCAEYCDVYLMWPETMERLREQMIKMTELSLSHQRKIDFGLRVHMVVRPTEKEAKEYAQSLVAKLADEKGREIRERALDSSSLGVARQAAMREIASDDGYIEDHLWTGIGRARSGCGAALVGSPEQIIAKIKAYHDLGIRAFIFSGYPHHDECQIFSELVLPHLDTVSFPQAQNRIPPGLPLTPLGAGDRR